MHTTLPQPPSPYFYLFSKKINDSFSKSFPNFKFSSFIKSLSLPPLNLVSPPFMLGCLHNIHKHQKTPLLPCIFSPFLLHFSFVAFVLFQQLQNYFHFVLETSSFFTPSIGNDLKNSLVLFTSTCKNTKKKKNSITYFDYKTRLKVLAKFP